LAKNKIIPYSRQSIDEEDISSVSRLLRKDIITQGLEHQIFEKNISTKINSKYAISYNSATSALHGACFALGVDEKSIVWTASNSFVASANCALYCGAKIDFLDINKLNWNIDISGLEEKLNKAKKNNSLPHVLITVHLGGLPTNQKKIKMLSRKYNFKIIEDASHSLGANFLGEKVGSCKWSDITVFSFHPVKIITTGEGGLATTNNITLRDKLRIFRSHGITREKKSFLNSNTLPWQYEQQFLGYNYRMSDFAAALGISQLKKLDRFVQKRNMIAKSYHNSIRHLPISFQDIPKDTFSSFHLFIIRLIDDKNGKQRNRLFEYLRKKNIYVNLHYFPIHLHPYYKKLGFKKGKLTETELYANDAISIPLHVNLTQKDQKKIIHLLETFFNEY